MSAWTTSVDSLVRNFLASLNAIVPPMQSARILDQDLIGFDDWGRVCDTLYSLLVIEPIRSSLPASERKLFDIPDYETEYDTFEGFSLIQAGTSDSLEPPALITEARLLYRFLPSAKIPGQFGLVETMRLDKKLAVVETSWESVDETDVYFTCLVPADAGWRFLDKITVAID